MNAIECPNRVNDADFFKLYYGERKSVFLAGGIQNCKDWQKDAIYNLRNTNLVLFNPRRQSFDMSNKGLTKEQIQWEYYHLRAADGIIFWFSNETIQPIVLFELGAALERNQPIWVGCHVDYERRDDVLIQCECQGYNNVVDNLKQLCDDVGTYYESIPKKEHNG